MERSEEITRIEDYIIKITISNFLNWGKINMISFYNAQENNKEETKKRYRELEKVIENAEGKIILMGDFNTKIGKDMIGKGEFYKTDAIGRQVYNNRSSKGAKNLINLAEKYEMIIGCTKKNYKKNKDKKKEREKNEKKKEGEKNKNKGKENNEK